MVQKAPKRPRGRPRAYDPETALGNATASFWRAGFAGTSLDDLSAATGMNRPSLYGAFGDKRAIYLRTLDRYIAQAGIDVAEALGGSGGIAAALQRVYDRALAMYFADPESPLGCFLIGTAATEAAVDEDVRERLAGGLRGLTSAFEERLRAAQAEGELPADADPAVLAALAGAVLHSIALRARGGDSRSALRAFSRAAIEHLCGGPPPASRRSRRKARRP